MYKYLAKEKTPQEFKNKYGKFPFSKVFKSWHSTLCSNGKMYVQTRKPLPDDVIIKYDLVVINE